MELIERTLVLLKPDAVARGLVGRRLIQRFEDAGLKIVGVKMVQIDDELPRGETGISMISYFLKC